MSSAIGTTRISPAAFRKLVFMKWSRFLLAAGVLGFSFGCGDEKVVTPPDTIAPSAVRDLSASASSPSMVLVSWTAPFDEDSTVAVHDYDIRFSGLLITPGSFGLSAPVDSPPDPEAPGTQQQATIGGLNGGQRYYVALRSRDEAGNISGLSNVAVVETHLGPDETPPAAISDLTITRITSTTAVLVWTATGDDTTFGTATTYDLRHSSGTINGSNWDQATPFEGEPVPSRTGTPERFETAGLQPGRVYFFAIRSTDDAGNLSALSNPVSATTTVIGTWRIRVNGTGDAPTIQAGIDSAKADDIVLVEPGRYFENIDFKGKAITVRSEMGPDVTIIDGSRKVAPVVLFQSGERRNSILEGLQITGGTGRPLNQGVSGSGGGVHIRNSEPSILRNTIVSNGVLEGEPAMRTSWGAGVICFGSDPEKVPSPLILGNRIQNNRARSNGGGIGVYAESTPEIIENFISDNSTMNGDGAGIWVLVTRHGGGVIRGNWIADNYANDHGGGIYAGLNGDGILNLEISQNVVFRNRADQNPAITGDTGGGLWLTRTYAHVFNNSIIANEGNGPDSLQGGGIVIRGEGSPIIERNIVAFSTNGGGIFCNGGTPTIRDNLAWANAGGNGIRLCVNWPLEHGNILADPLFCDPGHGDLSLRPGSPALSHPSGILGALATTCGSTSMKEGR